MDPLLDVVERVGVAWESGDYDKLRTLLHPEGSWVVVSAEPRTISDPDELIKAIEVAQKTTSYRTYTMEYEPLGGPVVLARGYVRTPAGHGVPGHTLARRYFLLEVRDGLLFRREHFPSEDDARGAFRAGWASE